MKTVHLTLYLNTLIGREVLPGIAGFAREQGDWVLQAFDRLPGPGEHPDGVIGIFGERQRAEVEALRARGIPLVCLSGFDPVPGIPLVNHDDAAIGAMAAEHLVAKGYQRFAFVHSPGAANAALRLAGFRDRLAALEMPELEVWEGFGGELEAFVRAVPKPVGVFAFNDKRARSVEHACRRAGISIPADVGLLGVNNDPVECELCPVPLSSMVLQFAETGRQAARLLDRIMQGGNASTDPVLLKPLRIEERISTDPLRVEDLQVRRALARMKMLMSAWPGVEALAEEMGMSKRSLEIRFREATGETVHQCLQRMRVEEAKRLFREERVSVTEAAERVGVGDINRFGLLFRKQTGMTARQYRGRSAECGVTAESERGLQPLLATFQSSVLR
jgi:LacI family transcriptional regulator